MRVERPCFPSRVSWSSPGAHANTSMRADAPPWRSPFGLRPLTRCVMRRGRSISQRVIPGSSVEAMVAIGSPAERMVVGAASCGASMSVPSAFTSGPSSRIVTTSCGTTPGDRASRRRTTSVMERFQNIWCHTLGQILSPVTRYATSAPPPASSQSTGAPAKSVCRSNCERSRISCDATRVPVASTRATTPAMTGAARRGASTATSRNAAAAPA